MVQIKRNQRLLFEALEEVIFTQSPLDWTHHEERQRGKTLSWTTTVYNLRQHAKAKEWKGLSRLIHVHRKRTEKKKTTHADAFYISSLAMSEAKEFDQGVRAHWGIENRLHWVKDVIFNEDNNRIRRGSGPMVASVLSTMAINILRKHGFDSITEGNVFAQANIKKMFCHIRT